MTKPKLLDLFCGEGGAGMGYHLAGFDVIGVDNAQARLDRYPPAYSQWIGGQLLGHLAGVAA